MPDLATLRDLAIVFMALLWIIMLAIIIFLLLKIKSLVDALPGRIEPLISSAKRTAETVEQAATSIKGTASFVNRTAVTPIIRVAAIGAATTRFVSVMLGRNRREVDNG